MTNIQKIAIIAAVLAIFRLSAWAADMPLATPSMAVTRAPLQWTAPSSNGLDFAQGRLELIGKADYRPWEPKPRGSEYRIQCGSHNDRTMWGWRIELTNGAGLAIGGIASWTMQVVNGATQRVDDARVHTQLRINGEWRTLTDELRAGNPLQAHHDQVRALREPLQRVYSRARHIFFEGRDEAAEKTFLDKEVLPGATEVAARVLQARTALAKAAAGADAYAAGQAALAIGHLDKVAPALRAIGARTTPESLLALRLARVSLECAADALDAEPPARALSMPAYDARTGLVVLVGGDHLDYLMNDVWVFDPRVRRWQQRHPKLGPEPRADHVLMGDGQGKITLRGGFIYGTRTPRPREWASAPYVHAGPGDWTYDLATDTWSGPADGVMQPADTRGYREGNHLPEYFTEGPRPDAAAHEKLLAALPVNTWVDLNPPRRFAGNRDWGTLGWDPERDMIYFYNGGHSAYAGTDVAHYHLAANRWDQLVEVEYPLNYIGASGSSAPGWSFNRRPWITNHIWNSLRYHPGLKRLVVAGRYTSSCFPRGQGQPDENIYFYDPDLGDWEKRVPSSVSMSCMGAQLLHVPEFGLIEWNRWKFNDRKLDWEKLAVKGKIPGPGIDFCGFVYEPKRARVLYFSGGTYNGSPYSGEVSALSIPSLEVALLKPEGSEHIKDLYAGKENMLGTWVLREVVYHPGLDLCIFSSNLIGGYSAALDLKDNRWVALKIPGPHPFGLSSSMTYDAKRDLVYAVGTRADVSVLRLDPRTLERIPLADAAAEARKADEAARAARAAKNARP